MLLEINCPSEYILDLFVNELILEDYCVEKVQCRSRKNVLIAYRGLLFLIKRRFEVFMNVILFKQIIQNAVVGEISEEMILCLIRAGMVLTNVYVCKTFAISRNSSDNIGTAIKSSLKTTMTKEKKETRTTATKYPKKESNKSGNVRKFAISQSKLKQRLLMPYSFQWGK